MQEDTKDSRERDAQRKWLIGKFELNGADDVLDFFRKKSLNVKVT